jgi:hypothetical protein
MTIVDPGAFTKPWTATATMDLRVDTEMLETVCEGSSERWLGSLADVRATARHVDTDVLALYVGEATIPLRASASGRGNPPLPGVLPK